MDLPPLLSGAEDDPFPDGSFPQPAFNSNTPDRSAGSSSPSGPAFLRSSLLQHCKAESSWRRFLLPFLSVSLTERRCSFQNHPGRIKYAAKICWIWNRNPALSFLFCEICINTDFPRIFTLLLLFPAAPTLLMWEMGQFADIGEQTDAPLFSFHGRQKVC